MLVKAESRSLGREGARVEVSLSSGGEAVEEQTVEVLKRLKGQRGRQKNPVRRCDQDVTDSQSHACHSRGQTKKKWHNTKHELNKRCLPLLPCNKMSS